MSGNVSNTTYGWKAACPKLAAGAGAGDRSFRSLESAAIYQQWNLKKRYDFRIIWEHRQSAEEFGVKQSPGRVVLKTFLCL